MDIIHVEIKSRIFRAGATQEQIAQVMEIEPSLFSRILRGLRAMPEDFEARVYAAIERLEAAEKAAEEARARVLAEGGKPREEELDIDTGESLRPANV